MSSRTLTLTALLIVSFFWATSGAVAKILLRSFPPIPLAMLRLSLATLILLPLAARQKINWKRAVWDLLPVSLFGAGNFILFFYGVQRTTANAATIIYTAVPLLTAFVSQKTIGEPSSRHKLLGILIGFVGVLLILILPLLEQETAVSGDMLGNLLIFLAVFLWMGYNVSSRYLTTQKRYSPITITTAMIGFSFVCFLLLTIVTGQMGTVANLTIGSNAFLIGYFAIFVTVIPFLLHQWIVKQASATTATLTTYLTPIFAFVFNAILLGESVTIGFMFGSALILIGVATATGLHIIQERRNKRYV